MSKFFTLFLLVPISFLLGSNWFPILESNINQPTNITKENMCVDVQLSVFLEGPYDSNINQMTTYLNYGQPDDFLHRGMLPGQVPTNTLAQPTPPGQPYNLAPWNYTGTITENTFSGPYDLDVVDWILISFREDIHPSTEFAKTVGLLYKDGHIEFLNPCIFELNMVPTTSAYVGIEHRNHMGIGTPYPIDFSSGVLAFDFTINQSYEQGGYGQKELSPYVFAMYSGDCNQEDDFPRYSIDAVDEVCRNPSSTYFDIYSKQDYSLNGDEAAADKIVWVRNNGIFSAWWK